MYPNKDRLGVLTTVAITCVWLVQLPSALAQEELCDDTCTTPNDGECDDGGPGSLFSICDYGTDCADCGPRDPSTIPNPQTDVVTSLAVWEGMKASGEGAVYCIHRSYYSYFGFGYTSQAEFNGDELVWWEVQDFDDQRNVTVSQGTSLDELPEAYMVRSMDQLYDYCQNDILQRPGMSEGPYGPMGNHVEFAVDSRGLMSRCFALALDCYDDCTDSIDMDRLDLANCDRPETPPLEETPPSGEAPAEDD